MPERDHPDFVRQTRDLLVQRSQLMGWLILAFLGFFAIADLRLNPEHVRALYTLKLIAAAGTAVAIVLLRRPVGRDWTLTVALSTGSLVFLTVAVQSNILAETVVPPAACSFGTLLAAALLPWGVVAQGIFASFTVLCMLFNSAWVTGTVVTFGYGQVSAVACAVASVYLAHAFERHRFARWRAEWALQEAKQAVEEAARTRSEFLAKMSLELRTPMNAIVGMTSLLLDTPLSVEQRHYTRVLRHSADGLLALINDLLDFSDIESNRLQLARRPFDVTDCIDSAIELIAYRAAEKDLELVTFIDEETPPVLVGDVTWIRQLLVNLLDNAVKFTEHGEVILRVRSVPADGDPRRRRLTFTVRDTGIGISEESRRHLFDAFRQAESARARLFPGIGLGLAMSHRLAQLMGGSIDVESPGVPGEGTTFTVSILVETATEEQVAAAREGEPDLPGRTVLLVEGHRSSRLSIAKMLRRWGMQVEACADATEARERLRRSEASVDLILADRDVATDVGAFVKESGRSQGTDIPLVLMAPAGTRHREIDNLRGAVSKPIVSAHLEDVLAQVLRDAAAPQPQKAATPVRSEFDPELGKQCPMRILVVDDNRLNQDLTRKMLERMSYTADVAANGIEALDALHRQPYDVVLMDVMMPEMDGLEASRHLRVDLPPERQPYVIAVTALGDAEACRDAGMDEYMEKPVRVRDLQKALRRGASARGLAPARPMESAAAG